MISYTLFYTSEPDVTIFQVFLFSNSDLVQSLLILFSFLSIIICSGLLLQLKQPFSIPVSLLYIFQFILSAETDLDLFTVLQVLPCSFLIF